MATIDGSGRKPTEAQPKRDHAPAGGAARATPASESRRGGETLPQATAAYLGPKQGLPKEFGRYTVQGRLGGGGMGAVYLVVNTELQREEALKVPHFEAADDPEVRERFLREARAAAALDHPNLCPVYDVGVRDGVYYLTMRYLKGKLLSDHCGAPQPPRKAVEIVAKLAQALAAAHAKGVIHRDLKPNNVMMCPGVGPVVMDFGLAKQNRGESLKLTQAGTTLGTPSYMPPEQVRGDLDLIGPASDVYSLGVILFELLTGTLPFQGKTAGEVYGHILHTPAPAPSALRAGLSPALDAVCRKAMSKAPEARYPTMKAFAAALIDYLKTTPPHEGAGALTVTKAGPADVFQAATVAPGHAIIPTPAPRAARATKPPREGRTTAAAPRPARTTRARAAAETDEGSGGWSVGGVLGMLTLILLMLGALGGIGYLIYMVSQNKAAPSPGPVAVITPAAAITPVAAPANEKAPEVPKAEPPKIEPKAKPDGAVAPKTGAQSRTKASRGGVDYELVKCVRNGSHPTWVTFTFAAECDREDYALAGGAGFRTFFLNLTVRDGEALKGKVREGPPDLVRLTKGIPSKFQITYADVDEDITEFDEVELGESNFGREVKFYGIKIEAPKAEAPKTVPPPEESSKSDPPKTDPPKTDPAPNSDPSKTTPRVVPKPEVTDPGVLLNEDFREVDVGGRPKGWEGDAFAVQKEDDLPCLEVTNDTAELYYVNLPRLFVKGDFVLESEFRLGGYHRLKLELRSRSSTPLPVLVDSVGNVTLEGAEKEAKGFKGFTNMRFRLTRKGDVYNVSINDQIVVGKTIPDKGAFEEIRIGLTGGKYVLRSRIYSVKITSLEKETPKPVESDPPPGIREDFSKATAGSLPDKWTGTRLANLAVQKSGDKGALELVDSALGGDAVQLPRLELNGDFYADIAAQLTERDTAVQVAFKGAKSKPLVIEIGYAGAVTVLGLPKTDGAKAWIANKPNVLRLERSGKDKGYVIKLNDAAIGAVPLAVAPGPFTEIDMAVLIKTPKQKSPQVTSVQIVPLEDAPAAKP